MPGSKRTAAVLKALKAEIARLEWEVEAKQRVIRVYASRIEEIDDDLAALAR